MTQPADSPKIPLPIGAVPDRDPARAWSDWDNEYRIVYGPEHKIPCTAEPKADVWVQASAVQYADGSIQPRNLDAVQSGPTVSVQAHWENYLTAAEARQLAHRVNEAADLIDGWSPEAHNCGFEWCTVNRWNEGEHHWTEYTPASLRGGDPHLLPQGLEQLKVGIGVVYDEGDLPCVIVHLDGGPREVDEDAHLKLSEAIALRDLLDRAVHDAAEALEHMTAKELEGGR